MSRQSVDAIVKSICDIMRSGNRAGALQYVPELTWILFLRILDEVEERERQKSKTLGRDDWSPSLDKPYRWRDWAAPKSKKRAELTEGAADGFFNFVNKKLLPHLKGLRNNPNATVKQKVISEILSNVGQDRKDRIGTERNFLDVLDKVDSLRSESVDPTHVFTLSQVYEGLLLKMGEKNNDGGQFFTPREVIRAMVRVVDPKPGKTVFDPCCGTGGFLAQAYEYIKNAGGDASRSRVADARQIEYLQESTFYGREKDNLIYPIALANLVLHDIDHPHIWHGNTLTGQEDYGGLFKGAPPLFDVVLTNPPFGGKEGPEAQTRYEFKTSSTQTLFLQEVIKTLKPGGRCGMVVDEGLLFRTNETAFVQTKRRLLEECDLWCVVSLPPGVFTQAGAGVKTNLLFFTKGEPTRRIWYYDLSGVKVTKGKPLTLGHFEEFFRLLPDRAESENSWSVDMEARLKNAGADEKNAAYDLKAVNSNKQAETDARAPEQLLKIIEAKGREISKALKTLSRRES